MSDVTTLDRKAAYERTLKRVTINAVESHRKPSITSDKATYRADITPEARIERWRTALPVPHAQQERFLESPAKRKIIRAGRRGGKTIGMAILAVYGLLNGRRVLYAAPTADQVQTFWYEVKRILAYAIDNGILKKNETDHVIELEGTKQRIRAKTAWNADTLRGDYADLLILDEFQLMNEDAWGVVGAPMLLDNDGDAAFVYTPPSLRTAGVTKASDPRHASKMFKQHQDDPTGRWSTFHFTSHENPHISEVALSEITQDMNAQSIRQEIEAIDDDEVPGALWSRELIEKCRHHGKLPEFKRIVVSIDPAGSSNNMSNETGIAVTGLGYDDVGYVLHSEGLVEKPEVWAQRAVDLYYTWKADRIIGENNFGGEMVESTLRAVDRNVSYRNVHASRGKDVRAEPISALYEKNRVKHVGPHQELENQYCGWKPGMKSPDLLDAAVWGLTELMGVRQHLTAKTGRYA